VASPLSLEELTLSLSSLSLASLSLASLSLLPQPAGGASRAGSNAGTLWT
jgi:hypothetical protein